MAYRKSGVITATSFNGYAAILNSIYADTHSGAVIDTSADHGYGQSTSIPTVSAGNPVSAAAWTTMFDIIHKCGTHQGIDVSPIPTSVSQGQLIVAYNDYLSTQTLTDVISKLNANRFQLSSGQSSAIAGPSSPSSPSWVGGLSYTFQIDFGSWDLARYFFNSGGAITIAGGVSAPVTSEDIFWQTLLSTIGILKLVWHDIIPSGGPGSNFGFYDLNSTPITVYERSPVTGGFIYSNNFISISGNTVSAPGVDGKISLSINLIDNHSSPATKTAGVYYFNIGLIQSSGVIPWPGSSVTVNVGTFAAISSIPYTGIPLTVTTSVPSATGTVLGAGVATTPGITISPAGGTAPYTYQWQKDPLLPTDSNLVFSNPTGGASTVSYNLLAGQIYSTIVKVIVTDSVSNSTSVLIPTSFNSNRPN